MTIYGYARVSTSDQTLSGQESDLEKAGCLVVLKEVVSGAKESRAQLDLLMQIVRKGDTVTVTSLDRLGRSMSELINILGEFDKRGVAFVSLRENLDTSSATGRLIFHFLAAIAEFERSLIRERTQKGLQAAREEGRVGGRPRRMTQAKIDRANDLIRNKGLTMTAAARVLDVHEATLRRAVGPKRDMP